MSRLLLALTLVSARRMARGRAANADLEGAIRDAYVDKHQVHHGSITVDGEAVEFLEAGPKDDAKPVLFCHGAAFSMTTWQHVGVLDALAERGMRAIALNLPGYGASSKTIGRKAERPFPVTKLFGGRRTPHRGRACQRGETSVK